MRRALFRPEAVPATKLYGGIIIAQPLSYRLLTSAAAATTALLLAFCFWGTYARKETAYGQLVPTKGIVEVWPSAEGRYSELDVVEGQRVEQGQRLGVVAANQTSGDGRDYGEQALSLLADQLAAVQGTIADEDRRFNTESQRLGSQRSGLQIELRAIREQRRAVDAKLRLASASRQRSGAVLALISRQDYDGEEASRLSLIQERSALDQRMAASESALTQIDYRLRLLPGESAQAKRELEDQVRALEQRRLEIGAQRAHALRAPVPGTVTAVRAVKGGSADPRHAALLILPEGSELEAHLFVPTRAAGFVESEQAVRVFYEAFPYQQFGAYTGRLVEVTKTVLRAEDVSIPMSAPEPVYRVRVALDEQQVRAYGKTYELQSGMLVHADIVLAERSLVQWLLDPLYVLKGRS
jgi:membrane fusion protein